jgi:hypothetical protein
LAVDDTGGEAFDGVELVGDDGTFAVNGLAKGIDDAADHGFADWHGHDASGAFNFIAFAEVLVFAEEHCANLIFFQVHGDAGNPMRELNELTGHDAFEAVDAGDTIAQRDDRTSFGNVYRVVVILNLLAENACYFVCSDLSHILFLL